MSSQNATVAEQTTQPSSKTGGNVATPKATPIDPIAAKTLLWRESVQRVASHSSVVPGKDRSKLSKDPSERTIQIECLASAASIVVEVATDALADGPAYRSFQVSVGEGQTYGAVSAMLLLLDVPVAKTHRETRQALAR